MGGRNFATKRRMRASFSFYLLAICLCQAGAMESDRSSGAYPANTNSLDNALLQAVSSSDVIRARAILKAAPALANATNHMGEPLLVRAAGQGNVDLVEALVDAGAAVDTSGPWRNTALYTALKPMLFPSSLLLKW